MSPSEFERMIERLTARGVDLTPWAVRVASILRPGYHAVSIHAASYLTFFGDWIVKTPHAEAIAHEYGYELPAKPVAADVTVKRSPGRPRKATTK